jgi:predicted metalloprotease
MAISFADQSKKIDEEIRALEAKKQEIQAKAHDEGMKAVIAAIEALNDLGYSYRVVETKGPKLVTPKKAVGTGSGKGAIAAGKVCPICEFATNPPHDKRAHKNQVTKQPFTAEELSARGLTRI